MRFAIAEYAHVFEYLQHVAAFAHAVDNSPGRQAVADIHDFYVVGGGSLGDVVETSAVSAHSQADKAVVEGNIERAAGGTHGEMVWSDGG